MKALLTLALYISLYSSQAQDYIRFVIEPPEYNWEKVYEVYTKDTGFNPGEWAIQKQVQLMISYITVDIFENSTIEITSLDGIHRGQLVATDNPRLLVALIPHYGEVVGVSLMIMDDTRVLALSGHPLWEKYQECIEGFLYLKAVEL